MNKVLKKISLLCSAVAVMVLIGTPSVNATEGKKVSFNKFSAGSNRYTWLAPKTGDLDHFYGAEDNGAGGFTYYQIDWDGNVTPTSDSVTPKTPEARPTYTIEVNDATQEIVIKNEDGSLTLDSISYTVLMAQGFATPKDAIVSVLGVKDSILYYAVKDTVANKTYIFNENKEVMGTETIPGNMAVAGYDYANYGIVKASTNTDVMILDFEGNIIVPLGQYKKAEINPFGFISLERDQKTTLLNYEGNILVSERSGMLMSYVTSNMARSNNATDYLKNGKHLFTIYDPVADETCHYVLELSGNTPVIPTEPENPKEEIENPKTSTGSISMTVFLGSCAIGMISLATKKLKTDF